MKQHITIEQLNELSDNGKEKLREWWTPYWSDILISPHSQKLGEFQYISQHTIKVLPDIKNNSDYIPLLSIGQMFEFLDEHNSYKDDDGDTYIDYISLVLGIRAKTLCDDLWEAVKEVLEK